MSRHGRMLKVGAVTIGLVTMLATSSGPAFAKPIPALVAHRAYVANTSTLRVVLITHSARVIDSAIAGNGASQYLEGALVFHCPAVAAAALINVGMPQITLAPVHGSYSFAVSYNLENLTVSAVGAIEQTIPTVLVHLSGRVKNSTMVVGSAELTGSPCTTGSIPYVARFNAADTKEISPTS